MTSIRDLLHIRESKDVPDHLRSLATKASSTALAMLSTQPRSNRSIALGNLCNYVAGEFNNMALSFPGNTSAMAWSCRNLFESNLILRALIADDAYLQSWLGQMLRDESEFIEGVIARTEDSINISSIHALKARLRRIQDASARHGIEPAKPFNVSELAKKLGMSDEYTSMFKLCSKYVHPSSVLINSWQKSSPPVEWTNIFVAMGQLYGGDSVGRVERELVRP